MIGLGRMGGNMSERLLKGGHEVVAFDPLLFSPKQIPPAMLKIDEQHAL